MTTEIKTTEVTFEGAVTDVLEDAKKDRVDFLEVLEGMRQLAQTNTEVGLVMMEHIVRGYDVLNKMTTARANLAALILKGKRGVTEEGDDVYDDIGPLGEMASGGDSH